MAADTEPRWGLAIDFGTTATAAATCTSEGRPESLALADGTLAMPSSVFADQDELVVGESAENQANADLTSYEPTPKRRVGQPPTLLGDTSYKASQLIGAVLAAMLDEALSQHNRRVPTSLVLTHPVSWKSSRRRVLADALQEAADRLQVTELPEPVFVAEPVAAAHWFAKASTSEGQCFAVYDLGGGTFDAAVVARSGAGYDVVSSDAIDDVGGYEFDNLLFGYLGQRHIAGADPELWSKIVNADPSAWDRRRQMQERVRHLKEGLTSKPERRILLPGVQKQVVVTVDDYNRLINDLIEKTVAKMEATIALAGLEREQISGIYQIGGAARTPLVQALLNRLHLPLRTEDHPKLVVALGGAVVAQRALLAADDETDHEPTVDVDEQDVVGDGAGEPPRKATLRDIPHIVNVGTELLLGQRGPAIGDRFRSAQKRLRRPTSDSQVSAFEARLAHAGVDLARTCRSRLGLRAPQTNLNRTMVIHMTQLGIDGEFGVIADRRPPNLHALLNATVLSHQRSGWLVYPQYLATVAGVPGGFESWRTQNTDGEARHVLQGFAQQGPYSVTAWFDEPNVPLRDKVYIDTPTATSSLTSRLASSVSVTTVVDGADGNRASEEMIATVTIKGQAADITARLCAVGAEPDGVAEDVKAEMLARAGVNRVLVNGEDDTFVGGQPCRYFRFESVHPAAAVPSGSSLTTWVWIGPIDGRVATIMVGSRNPALSVHQYRDLVHVVT